jgi:hypothetical protein
MAQNMGAQYWHKVASIRPANLIGYWPNWEPDGTDVFDYSGLGDRATSTGLGLAVAGADGVHQTRAFNATPSYINHLSAEFVSRFNGAEGSILIWLEAASVGLWTDTVNRVMVHLHVDANNYFYIQKSPTDYELILQGSSGGVTHTIGFTDENPGVNPFMLGITWSAAANQYKGYYNGAQKGATIAYLGAWAGALDVALVGVYGMPATLPWLGYLDHYAVWNVPLSASEIKQFSEV